VCSNLRVDFASRKIRPQSAPFFDLQSVQDFEQDQSCCFFILLIWKGLSFRFHSAPKIKIATGKKTRIVAIYVLEKLV